MFRRTSSTLENRYWELIEFLWRKVISWKWISKIKTRSDGFRLLQSFFSYTRLYPKLWHWLRGDFC